MPATWVGSWWVGTAADKVVLDSKYLCSGMRYFETDTNTTYIWIGTQWLATGGVTDHGVLTGLDDPDHDVKDMADSEGRLLTGVQKTDLTDGGQTVLHVHPGGGTTIEIQEDDAKVADAGIVNFEGDGVEVIDEGGGKATVNIPGGGGWTQCARVYHSADQSIPNATWTALALDSERFDTDVIHDTVTNNSRLTCKTAGKYVIVASAMFASNATGLRGIKILLNSTTIIAKLYFAAISGDTTPTFVSTLYELNVGDYVQMQGVQTSGGALNVVSSGNETPEFMMARVA